MPKLAHHKLSKSFAWSAAILLMAMLAHQQLTNAWRIATLHMPELAHQQRSKSSNAWSVAILLMQPHWLSQVWASDVSYGHRCTYAFSGDWYRFDGELGS
jgi:hypothetical protein